MEILLWCFSFFWGGGGGSNCDNLEEIAYCPVRRVSSGVAIASFQNKTLFPVKSLKRIG